MPRVQARVRFHRDTTRRVHRGDHATQAPSHWNHSRAQRYEQTEMTCRIRVAVTLKRLIRIARRSRGRLRPERRQELARLCRCRQRRHVDLCTAAVRSLRLKWCAQHWQMIARRGTMSTWEREQPTTLIFSPWDSWCSSTNRLLSSAMPDSSSRSRSPAQDLLGGMVGEAVPLGDPAHVS
jgi:hypothetical protein